MSQTKANKLRWYDRGVGIFCGGFLGFAFSAMVVILLGVSTTTILFSVFFGIVSGLVVGYFFPLVTEAFFWILSLFV